MSIYFTPRHVEIKKIMVRYDGKRTWMVINDNVSSLIIFIRRSSLCLLSKLVRSFFIFFLFSSNEIVGGRNVFSHRVKIF